MDTVYVIHSVDILTPMLAIGSFILGWFKGGAAARLLIWAIEALLGAWIQAKASEWMDKHPRVVHFIENHSGLRPSQCNIERCQSIT